MYPLLHQWNSSLSLKSDNFRSALFTATGKLQTLLQKLKNKFEIETKINECWMGNSYSSKYSSTIVNIYYKGFIARSFSRSALVSVFPSVGLNLCLSVCLLCVCLSVQFFDSGAETSERISTKLSSFYLPLMPIPNHAQDIAHATWRRR
jgi:hypothetical protein